MGTFIALGVIVVIIWMLPSPLSWFSGRKLRHENRDLRGHLYTKMEIEHDGINHLKEEIARLKTSNENLRVTNATLASKPGRPELRQFRICERAIAIMRTEIPVLESRWQNALGKAEQEMQQIDAGNRKFVRRLFHRSAKPESLPQQGTKSLTGQDPIIETD